MNIIKLSILVLTATLATPALAGECTAFAQSDTLISSTVPVVRFPGYPPYGGAPVSEIELSGLGRAQVCASAQVHVNHDHPLHLYYYLALHPYWGSASAPIIHHGYLGSGAQLIDTCAIVSWDGGDADAILYVWARTPPSFVGKKPKRLHVSPQGGRMTALMQIHCGDR